MSDEREPTHSIDKIIRDWLCKLEGQKFDSRVEPDALFKLIKKLSFYGWTEEKIDTEFFKNKVIQRITHDFTPKAKGWKSVTWDKLDRAIGAFFALDDEDETLTDEEAKRAAKASEPRKVPSKNPYESKKAATPKEFKMLDRSKLPVIELNPIQTEEEMLDALGLKK